MLSIERRDELKRIITECKTVTVVAMAEHFAVSQETIRRDLAVLASEGAIIKSYGGATLRRRVSSQASQAEKVNFVIHEKHKIAHAAVSFIYPNDCVFLDHSTTVLAMCAVLEDIPITVVTNSLQVLNSLANKKRIALQSVSGTFDPNTQAFWGSDTSRYVQKHFFDKAFFSCRCLDIQNGIYDSRESIADIHRSLIANSNESYLLADHNKLGRAAFVKVEDLNSIDYFITDCILSDEWSHCFSSKNVHVIVEENDGVAVAATET